MFLCLVQHLVPPTLMEVPRGLLLPTTMVIDIHFMPFLYYPAPAPFPVSSGITFWWVVVRVGCSVGCSVGLAFVLPSLSRGQRRGNLCLLHAGAGQTLGSVKPQDSAWGWGTQSEVLQGVRALGIGVPRHL